MQYFFPRLANKKGVALITTFFAITVLLIFCGLFVMVSISQNMASDRFRRRTRAFYLAESGLDRAIFWLRTQPSPPVGDKIDPWGGAQNLGEGSYTVSIFDLGMVGANSSIRRYRVRSSGSFGNITRTLTNYVQVDNYARYLWFTDREVYGGVNVWFWTQDRLNGPTHTNSHFNIYGNPVFESEVRSVDDYIRFYNNGINVNLQQTSNSPYDEPVFLEGVDFGVQPTTMPNQALSLRSAANSSEGIYLSGNTKVVLNSDGTMSVTNSKKKWKDKDMPLPANGALFVNNGSLHVSGTLNGRLTVGSSSDVVIPDSIVYADDPKLNPNSDDVLGVISERDIVVSYDAPHDLEIDACMMSLGTSFMMEDWWVGPAKGTLSVYGGIIQDERGPVGTFNSLAGTKVSGYSKDYSYDPRLLSNPPPYMPTTGDYITLSWQEN
ncbi:MAG: DUF4900 domain-containing protein [Candidatus Omnitrophota bacterium]|jgi:hypothetical protein|nr:MAG: DUF4900 domain-containing protein [Candidatus Omnitrophota bacterium]